MKVKYARSNLITTALQNRPKRNQSRELRMSLAEKALATKKELSEGRTGLYVRQIPTKATADASAIPDNAFWENMDKEYIGLHSFDKGSLFDVLLTLHCRRFKLFSKGSLRSMYLLQGIIGSSGLEQQLESIKTIWPQFTIDGLYNALTSQIRGKGTETDPSALAGRFSFVFTGKGIPEGEDVSTSSRLSLLLGEAVCAEFETWQDMIANPSLAAELIEKALVAEGYPAQGLGVLFRRIQNSIAKEDGKLKFATVAYDSARQRIAGETRQEQLFGVVAAYAKQMRDADDFSPKQIKTLITTENANGLSWLFGAGRQAFLSDDIDPLLTVLGIDKDDAVAMDDFMALKECIQRLPTLTYFGDSAYASSRVSLQGRVDSLVSNHVARLLALQEQLATAEKEPLEIDEYYILSCKHVLAQSGTTAEKLLQLNNTLPKLLSDAQKGIDLLLGGGAISDEAIHASIAAMTRFRGRINRIVSTLETINGAIKSGRLEGLNRIEPPKWTASIHELVFIRAETIDPVADRVKTSDEFNLRLRKLNEFCDDLKTRYQLDFKKAHEQNKIKFTRMAEQRAQMKIDCDLLTQRNFLSRMFSNFYRSSEGARMAFFEKMQAAGLLPAGDKGRFVREARECLYERMHHVFVHPLDTRPKKLLKLEEKALKEIDFCQWCTDLLNDKRLNEKDSNMLLEMYYGILLQGLPDYMPTGMFREAFTGKCEDDAWSDFLEEDQFERYNAIKLVQQELRSKLSGLAYRLAKRRFTDARTFAVFNQNAVVYVPKNATWKVPALYYKGRFGALLESDLVIWDAEGVMNVATSAKAMSKALTGHVADIRHSDIKALLREMPHEWRIETNIAGWGSPQWGIRLERGEVTKAGNFTGMAGLTIPRHFAKAFDSLLDEGKISPPTLTFIRHYEVDRATHQAVELPGKRECVINLPVESNVKAEPTPWTPDYILAVDPGEYGMGVALLRPDGDIADGAFLSVPLLAEYRDKKKRHRTVDQPKQRYRSKFSDAMQKNKEACVGELANLIDTLVIRLNAIPVFEMLDSTDKNPVSDVYNQLISWYTWGDNDAQNSERETHWFGAGRWETSFNRRDEKGKEEPLKVFPGAKIGSFGNSQTCSCCQRNPVEVARNAMEEAADIPVRAGEVQVGSSRLTLFRPDPDTVQERKKKHFTPLWVLAEDRTYKKASSGSKEGRELIQQIKISIRRPHISRHAKESSQSQYFCAFTDCQTNMNAEINSAINVGRKFLARLNVTPAVK